MARVTVEDCIEQVPNRFELVILAAQRAKELSAGAMLTVNRDRDKNPVVALREIAEQTVDLQTLEDNVIRSMQKNAAIDDTEEDLDSLLAADHGAIADVLAEEAPLLTDGTASAFVAEENDDTATEDDGADEDVEEE